jgi:hypothetical protein
MAHPYTACDPLPDLIEEKMRHIGSESIQMSINLTLNTTVAGIRNETAEGTARLENPDTEQQEVDAINLALILGEALTEGPIQALPLEMLSEIFCHYVESNASPWELVTVCRHWMQAALSTPQLWGKILFISQPEIAFGQSWIVDGRRKSAVGKAQICNTTSGLNEALSRSGATPLEICIRLEENLDPYTDVLSAMALLLNDPTSRRIKSLIIYSAKAADTFLVPGRFPLLEDIRWYGPVLPWTDQLFSIISATSRRLEKVQLPGILISQLVDLPFWSRIKVVASDRNSMARDLNKIAHKLPNLENHFGGPPDWPNRYTAFVIWSNIRSLKLRCCPLYLQNLHTPCLELLELEEPWIGRDLRPYPELSFPRLTTLTLTTSDARWLSRALMPRLTTLYLNARRSQSKEDITFAFQSLSLPTVRALTLGPSWNDAGAVAALKSVPNLLILKLYGTMRTYCSRVEVLTHLSGGRLCPRLESISLGTKDHPVYMLPINIVPAIEQSIKTRKMIKTPFKEFTVWWAGRTRSFEQRFI